MTRREWKPGDVAMVRLDPETEIRVMYNGANWVGRKGAFYDLHASARPLVVIDPEDREQVERLANLLHDPVDHVADCLREFANPTPPKPEEPTGLGAVVEDANGRQWVRLRSEPYHWRLDTGVGDYRTWSDFDAARVLSEGVTA